MKSSSIDRVFYLFNLLSKSDQLEIADKIHKQTFEERWQLLDADMPDVEFSEEDIMKEVQAVRYGNNKA